MSMFQKLMASIGIGAARVDTLLEKKQIQPGEEVKGQIKIYGGNIEQKIDKLYLYVMTQYEKEVDDKKTIAEEKIQQVDISVDQTIQPEDETEHSFSFILDKQTPISNSRFPVWIHTGLDIKRAIDPKDNDRLEILPHKYLKVVLDALEELGFKIKSIENEFVRTGKFPFIQELEFRPTNLFRNELDELEMVYFITDDAIQLFFEIDRRGRGVTGLFSEALDLDESQEKLRINKTQIKKGSTQVAELIKDFIECYI
ncbi:sporulation protein [Halanaerocella petrolearia]